MHIANSGITFLLAIMLLGLALFAQLSAPRGDDGPVPPFDWEVDGE